MLPLLSFHDCNYQCLVVLVSFCLRCAIGERKPDFKATLSFQQAVYLVQGCASLSSEVLHLFGNIGCWDDSF